MEEEVIQQHAGVHRLVMSYRLDHRVHIELAVCICVIFSRERVPHAHVRENKEDLYLVDIWRTLIHDMTKVMYHVVDAMMLIQRLQAHTQSMSSP